MKFTLLSEETFDEVSICYLQNKHMTREMYNSALISLMSAKTDITKYISSKGDKHLLRLAINKLIILGNEFGVEGSQRLMFYRCKDSVKHLETLKTIWVALGLLEEPLQITDVLTIDYNTVEMDMDLYAVLSNLTRAV